MVRISYLFQLILQQLARQKVSYILVFLQVLISVFLITLCITAVKLFGDSYITLSEFRNPDVLIVPYAGSILNSKIKTDSVFDELCQIENIKAETIPTTYLYTEKERTSIPRMVYVYGELMSSNMVLNLKEGIGLDNAEIKDGAYPIVVPEFSYLSEYYYSKDIFQLYYIDDSVEDRTSINDTLQPVNVYVCGILRYPYLVYSPGILGLPSIIEQFLSEPIEDFILAKDFEIKDELMLSQYDRTLRRTAVVEIQAEKGSSEYKKAYNDIYSRYGAVSIKTLLELGYANYTEGIGDYVVTLIIVAVLSFVSLTSINIFLFNSLKNEYSIYFMCGSTLSMCVFLEAMRNVLVVIVPAILGGLGSYLYLLLMDNRAKYYFDIVSPLAVGLYVILIFLISTLYFLIKLGKTRPIENIRLMVKE